MNKSRLEAFSDGVFAILITLLVLEIKIPELHDLTNAALWHALVEREHIFLAYLLSVGVIAMYWLNHHFFFSTLVKNIDRMLVLLNVIFLTVLSMITFSAGILGEYPSIPLSSIVYGINILLVNILMRVMYNYALKSHEIDVEEMASRQRKQANIRYWITNICVILGMIVSAYSPSLTIVLYIFPLVFNNVPGLLNKTEKIFGFEIK